MGRKIVTCIQGEEGVTLVYDTTTSSHSILRTCPDLLLQRRGWQAAIAAGKNKVYAFYSRTSVYPYNSESEMSVGGMFCRQGFTGKFYCTEEWEQRTVRSGAGTQNLCHFRLAVASVHMW